MNPEVLELMKQIEADVVSAALAAGAPQDGSVVVRLRPDLHEVVCERVADMDIPEGYCIVFGGFPVTQGPKDMEEAWRFRKADTLPNRQRAVKIKPKQ